MNKLSRWDIVSAVFVALCLFSIVDKIREALHSEPDHSTPTMEGTR